MNRVKQHKINIKHTTSKILLIKVKKFSQITEESYSHSLFLPNNGYFAGNITVVPN